MKKVLVTVRLLKSNEERASKIWDAKLNLNNEKNEGILLENDNSCLKITTKKSCKIDQIY